MTFNTGNPVPSTDPRDLYDTAGIADKLTNGADPFVADRLGKLRQSWAGMEADHANAQEGRETAFTLSQADKESRFQAFLVSSGYVSKGDYASGVVLAERNEYVAVGAATTGTSPGLYRPNASATVPLTLTGTWATDSTSLVLLGDDVLRQELAAASGAGLIGYSGGVTVSEFLDALQSAAPGKGADLIGYGSSDVKQALDDLQTVPANEILLVPSQFATIQAALAEVLKRRYDFNITVEVRLEAGYQIPAGIDVRNCDLRNVRITSVDATVTLAAGFTGVTVSSDRFADGAIFYGENAYMPALACLIDAAGVGGPGYCVNQNSTGKVAGACGVMNAGKFGLYVANGSKCLATNSKFTGANWGNRVTTNSTLCAPQIDCSGAKLQNYEGSNVVAAMDVSRGSIAYITGTVDAKTNLTNSAGRGLAVRRSFVSATHVDASGAALDGIRATTGAWIAANGSSANNCLVDNVSCYASWIDGSDGLVATGAGRYGLLVQDGGKANCRGANFSGALGGRGVSVVMGSSATINGANCRQTAGVDSATDIFVSDGSIIHAAGATGGTNITVLTLNAAGLIFK